MIGKSEFEVVILGGSYAGLSAALALGRSKRKVLIVDSGKPCNISTPYSHNFLTQDGVEPQVIASQAKDQVLKYPTVSWMDGLAIELSKADKLFEISTLDHWKVLARRVIFATGLKDLLPEIPGFADCWGKTIIHCPYCHGYEVRGRKTGIMIRGAEALEMVRLIQHWAGDLTLFLNGDETLSEEDRRLMIEKDVNIVDQPIRKVIHDHGTIRSLELEDGKSVSIDALYARVATAQKSSLPEQSGCKLTESDHVEVDMFGKTTVEGIYAVGDCAHPMRSVATAVYSGNMAGAMLNKEMIEEDFYESVI